ncbi:baseplate J/gp47 family protein [Paenibacillus alvei]|uniref:baseplate assembly protein n=1 Tax=Paenibacillus alvei TaxID=44250 RepID=UPI00227F4300|nr:baseplate J/gp47 family protein [Paenibacillus alvei]MCY7486425.1 baseplate J/gp47 family protein [Paenibacillus alvei]
MSNLQFVDDDVTSVSNDIITVYEGLTGRTLYPADPIRLFLMSLASIIVQQRVLINQTAKGNLLRYAQGDQLDAMGEFTETSRLTAAAAVTTVEFRLSMPLVSATIIPAGTRIGPQGGDGQLYFSTTEVFEIPAGVQSGSVVCKCSIAGIVGNGFLPGKLNVLIDPLPFIQSVKNTTTSTGGAAEEVDNSYRERIRTAPEQFSTAGPYGAYQYWAKAASSSIIDVAVHSPSEGEVVVVPLMQGGELPSSDILESVNESVNDRKRRPLTDKVTVAKPTQVSYDINIKYWINRDRAAESTNIQSAVVEAVNQYRTWQKSKLGRAINPSELVWRVMAAGALRVEVTTPVYVEVGTTQVAKDGTVNITFGGFEDD